ncbi:ATP-binding cassette domain-containing protein [Nocardia sp. NPDC051832]|uniref:ABC transporter ATP-binding protein n=1 Tax=Nocardia sp. NPDC051832 TaxID=3155673 RepID=UPI00343B5F2A
MNAPIAELRGLTVAYPGSAPVLREVSLTVRRSETVAVVGASGSGKTTLIRALLGTLDDTARVDGTVLIDGVALAGKDFRAVRGTVLGYVSQDPFAAMDPIMSVGTNIAQAWRIARRPVPEGRIVADLAAVDITDPATRVRQRPHTWSGGMLQRGSVTTARALDPALVLADEPTSALDEANAHRVMAALTDGAAALLIVSHDRRLVEQYADRVYLVEDGTVVESSAVTPVVAHHVPARKPVPAAAPILRAHGVTKRYPSGAGSAATDLEVRRGEIVGLAGPSGAGKSTLLRVLAGVEPPSAGRLVWAGRDGPPPPGSVGVVFQNAMGSLDPRRPIYRSITEPLQPRLRSRLRRADALAVARTALERVGLGAIDPGRYPRELSGGQAQRVALARALAGDVRLLLADEPTASLDESAAARIMTILRELADDGMAIVLVSHSERVLGELADTVVRIEPIEELPTVR